MGNLAFPQLSSGSQVQYPLRKRRNLQSPINAFADGSIGASNLNANASYVWELAYSELTATDQQALLNLFTACQGSLLPFTFIDPTANMLSSSSNLTSSEWIADPLLTIQSGATDPEAGNGAFTATNAGQVAQQLTQQVNAPANYQYCFSVYAVAPSPTQVTLTRTAVSAASEALMVGASWVRLIQTAQLVDDQLGFNVSISIPPGQSITLFGPQLEPQLWPSRYRATNLTGGVYSNAHFLGDSITFASDAPGLFSTLISIEAN